MALTDENGGNFVATMPMAPAYGGGNGWGNGFGADGWWVLLLLLCGWGNGFGGGWGMGGFGGGLGIDFPWLLNGQNAINANTNAGFDHAATQAALGDLNTAVTSGFGNVATQLCGGFAGVNANINSAANGISQQLNTNEMASLNRSFAAQTANMQGMNAIQAQLAQCCCDNRAATQDVKYTIATEACATRANNTANTQAILDKLCQLELDGIKGQLAAAQRENVALQNAVNMATMRESQTAQTAQILAGQAAEIDGVYNRLKNCPVPSMPVYGNTPIFTCGGTAGCGCGSNSDFVN